MFDSIIFSVFLALIWAAPVQFEEQVLRSVSPNTVVAGSGGITITLRGSGFNSSSMVVVRNANGPRYLSPVFIDASTLQVAIAANLLAVPAAMSVQVFLDDAHYSQALPFYVYSSSPPVVTSMIPAGGLRGTSIPIALTGTNLIGATITFGDTGITANPDTSNYLLPENRWNLQASIAPDSPLDT